MNNSINLKYQSTAGNRYKSTKTIHFQLQDLQNDITQLQNKFLRFKIIVSQLNKNQTNQPPFNIAEINFKMTQINQKITLFIHSFQRQLKSMQQYLVVMDDRYKNVRLIQKQSRKDEYLVQRLKHFERMMKQRQTKQQKLIRTINALLMKYNMNQHLHFIQNDIELKNKIIMSQVQQNKIVMSHAQYSHDGYQIENHQQHKNRSRLPIYQTIEIERRQRNLSARNNQSNNLIMRSQSPLQFKKMAKTNIGGKMSLKGQYEIQRQTSPTNPHNSIHQMLRKNSVYKERRSQSTQTHDHRFAMMIKKLHQ